MTETSTIGSFQDALVASLSGLSAFAGIPVDLGIPQGQPLRTCVKIGDAQIAEKPWALGKLRMREDYTQNVWISVVQEGGAATQTSVRNTAFALRDAIAGQVKADSTIQATLSGGGWANVSGANSVKMKGSQTRRECELSFTIQCTAII